MNEFNRACFLIVILVALAGSQARAGSAPVVAGHGMVVSQEVIASTVGAEVLKEGGSAVDAAVATAFALAVTHPTAGNIGGGGFLVLRTADGQAVTYDFREMAPAAASPDMWMTDGKYDPKKHHFSHMAVGVPGTVAGLHMAWKDHGKLPWKRLVEPAIKLASEGITVSHGLSRSFKRIMPRMEKYEASKTKFMNGGAFYEAGDTWVQSDLANSLQRISDDGPAGFYEGQTAELLVAEMEKNGGIITADDLKAYVAKRREPIRGTYRGHEIISMPPPSSGGVAIVEMLNMLEKYDVAADGFGSSANAHRMIEVMRRAYADRAQHVADPDFNPEMPIAKLCSKNYAAKLVQSIDPMQASKSAVGQFTWPHESKETTHLSVVDAERNAVALTYTLEYGYGSAIVVPGAGFLLNNEMGDFNAGAGLTDATGLIGTLPNLAEPKKRMLSSMSPTIVAKDGRLRMVTGTPGGRTIINTVLQTILNVVDHEMNAQEAVDAARIHHQWLPDRVTYERDGLSPDTVKMLSAIGHQMVEKGNQGAAEVIVVEGELLNGGVDRRVPGGGAVGH